MADPKHYKEFTERCMTEDEDLEQEKWFSELQEQFFLKRQQNRLLWKLRIEVLDWADALAEEAGNREAIAPVIAIVKATFESGDVPKSRWEEVRRDIQLRACETGGDDLYLGRLDCAVNCALWIVDEHLRVLDDPYQTRRHLRGVHQAAAFIAPWLQRRAIDAWRTALRPMFERVVSEYE